MATNRRPALKFDGVDDYVDLGASSDYEFSTEFTLEAWIYVERSVERAGIMTKFMSYQGDQSGYALMLDEQGGVTLAIKPEFDFEVVELSSGKDSVPLQQWHHVAGTYDGKSMKVYIDGALKGTRDVGPPIGYMPAHNLLIGVTRNIDLGKAFFAGMISQVRVWNHARTAKELQDSLDTRLNGDEAGLAGYWPLDEAGGKKAGDASAARHAGTLEGNIAWTHSEVPFPNAANPGSTSPPAEPPPEAPAKVSGKINPASSVASVSGADVRLTTPNPLIKAGDRVLFVQMDGAVIDTTDDPAKYGSVQKLESAGIFEFSRIASVETDQYTLMDPLKEPFDTQTGSVQIVKVSEHAGDVEVSDVQVDPYAGGQSGHCGGVIVIEAAGAIHLTGTIDASGKGFPGGAPSLDDAAMSGDTTLALVGPSGLAGHKGASVSARLAENAGRGASANGGGGGNRHNGGGGGGANCGSGGLGGRPQDTEVGVGGIGGVALKHVSRLFLGGGGGGGQQDDQGGAAGAPGGGIIFLRAKTIAGSAAAALRASGSDAAPGQAEGGGGGGGGGTIVLAARSIEGVFAVDVRGGNGSSATQTHGLGGGGGGGRVLWASALPAAVKLSFAGGSHGATVGDARGATDGGPGCSYKLTWTDAPKASAEAPSLIDTSAVLATALERLNRQSVLSLLEKFAHELDAHCMNLDSSIAKAMNGLRDELKVQIDSLRKSTEANHTKIGSLGQQIVDLKQTMSELLSSMDGKVSETVKTQLDHSVTEVLNKVRDQVNSSVKTEIDRLLGSDSLSALQKEVEGLQAEIEALEKATHQLTSDELKQVRDAISGILQNMDLRGVLAGVKIEVNGEKYALDQLLLMLANRPEVKETQYSYHGGDLSRVEFVLTNGKRVTFTCGRKERPELDAVDLEFHTADLEGFAAEFRFRFRRQPRKFAYCEQTVTANEYDALYQSNVVYDLRVEG